MGNEVVGLELDLLGPLDEDEVGDLFGDEVAEVADDDLKVGVDSLSELVDQGVEVLLLLLILLFVTFGDLEVAQEVFEVVGVEVVDLGVEEFGDSFFGLHLGVLEDFED